MASEYIRTLDEAMDELAAILELPDRRAQIIRVTGRIAVCLAKEPRDFLVDCQAAVIGGGLEALRKRRREQLAAYEAEALPEAEFVEIDVPDSDVEFLLPEAAAARPPRSPDTTRRIRIRAATKPTREELRDPLMEEVGAALDAIKIVEIARKVFPRLKDRPLWAAARLVRREEKHVRNLIEEAMRRRSDARVLRKAEGAILAKVDAEKPEWTRHLDGLMAACRHAVKFLAKHQTGHHRADDPEVIFAIVALQDERVDRLIRAAKQSAADVVAEIVDLRVCVDWIQKAEDEGRA